MMNASFFNQVSSSRLWANLAISGALSTCAVLAAIVPSISFTKIGLETSSAAYAQSVEPQQITQYARAAYEIEQMRQRDYAEAKRLMGGNVPGDVCRQPNIPPDVKAICARFLGNSAEIICKNELTVNQFNEITRLRQTNPQVQQQVQSELLKISGITNTEIPAKCRRNP